MVLVDLVLTSLRLGHDGAAESSVVLVDLVSIRLRLGHDGAADSGGGLISLGNLDLGHFDDGLWVEGVRLVKRGLNCEVIEAVDGLIFVSRWWKSQTSLYHCD